MVKYVKCAVKVTKGIAPQVNDIIIDDNSVPSPII